MNGSAESSTEENPAELLDRARLKKDGWRQGACVRLAPLITAETRPDIPLNGVLVSQDCDLLSESLVTEPFLEVLPYEILERPPESTFARGLHPRILELPHADATLRLDARHRLLLRRDPLRNPLLKPHDQIGDDELELILDWLTDRYTRPALPDEFCRRVKTKKVQEAVDGQRRYVRMAGIQLDPHSDIGPEDTYDVRLLVIGKREFREDTTVKSVYRDLVKRLAIRFRVPGVELPFDWPKGASEKATSKQVDAAFLQVFRWDDEFTLAEAGFWVPIHPDGISYGVESE